MKKTAVILTIGNELLNGSIIDTNSNFLQKKLNKLGIICKATLLIGDKIQDLTKGLQFAIDQKVNYIFCTGGLGPTADDITLEAIGQFIGDRLITFPQISELLTKRYQHHPNFNEGISKQSIYPSTAEIIPNDLGTASACKVTYQNTEIFVLPGVPFEMVAIYTKYIEPKIHNSNIANNNKDFYLLLGRLPEVQVEQRIASILNQYPTDIKVAYLPQLGYVKLHITPLSDSFALAYEAIKLALTPYILATEDISLPERVLQMCKKYGLTIGCGESCSGGSVGSGLTDIPGASTHYMGTIGAYANAVKMNILNVPEETLLTKGAVSKDTVMAMAQGVQQMMQTDVAITTSGILGPGGATTTKPVGLVWIGLRIKEYEFAFEHYFPYERLQNKTLTINNAYCHFILECDRIYKNN